MASHIIGNRNSTPEAGSGLRPPMSRTTLGTGHQVRTSADMGAFAASARNNRPASEVIPNQMAQQRNSQVDVDKATQDWIAEIDSYEQTLEEMAGAALDNEFKEELAAIEHWFRVLSEPERTAAMYALLQQATQMQVRFFIGILQQRVQSHPSAGQISANHFGEKESMSARLSAYISQHAGERSSVISTRSAGGAKRNSGIPEEHMKNIFPDAVAHIAKEKADFQEQTGAAPAPTRNSAVGDRILAPTISAPQEERQNGLAHMQPSPWRQRSADPPRPRSSAGSQVMGQFSQPLPSAGLRPSRQFPLAQENNMQSVMGMENGQSIISPFLPGQSWGSVMNTPMVPNFSMGSSNQADLIAATQAKLGAMSTINSRFQMDDPRKFRRARSTETDRPSVPNISGPDFRTGQSLTQDQVVSMLQQQQSIDAARGRSPASSPARTTFGISGVPQQNGFLSVFDPNQVMLNNSMGNLSLGHGHGHGQGHSHGHYSIDNGYLSDASDINRGRSPRGRRGTSKPPDDPTNVELLKDIPNWLRSLRLHKYTDNLKGMDWRDLIMLDEDGLEKKGVSAQGARKKMIKVFEQVREAQGM